MSSAPLPVALFSIDAAELALFREWDRRGLASDAGGRCRGRPVRPADPMPSKAYNTAWACIDTGTDLGDHEVVLRIRSRFRHLPAPGRPSEWRRQPPFWRYLSDAGPLPHRERLRSTPSRLVPWGAGARWGTADPHWGKFGRVAIEPAQVRELTTGGGGSAAHLELHRQGASHREATTSATGTDASLRPRSGADAARAADETKWQFFFGSFGEPHQAGHLLWHLGDPGTRSTTRSRARSSRRPAEPSTAVDSALGRLIGELPPDCRSSSSTRTAWGRTSSTTLQTPS